MVLHLGKYVGLLCCLLFVAILSADLVMTVASSIATVFLKTDLGYRRRGWFTISAISCLGSFLLSLVVLGRFILLPLSLL